jgi:lysophospholipase
MERERYGRGGGGGGGINRYPDVSGRPRPSTPQRDDRNYSRGDRPVTSAPPPRSSNEPWSDVPPELEAMLRAQVAQKPAPSRPSAGSANPVAVDLAAPVVIDDVPVTRPRATRKPAAAREPAAAKSATAGTSASKGTTAKPRASRKPAAAKAPGAVEASGTAVADGAATDAASAPKAAAKPRATRKPKAAATAAAPDAGDVGTADAAPKRRTTRKTATTDQA